MLMGVILDMCVLSSELVSKLLCLSGSVVGK